MVAWARADPLGASLRLGALVAAVLFAAWLLRFLYRVYVWNLFLNPLNRIPGPPVKNIFPPLGHFPQIFREEAAAPHIRWLREYAPDTGVVRYNSLFLQPRVMVANPDVLRTLLSAQSYDFPKEPIAGPLKEVFGGGLLFSEGGVHRRQRRLLNPAFSYAHVRGMVPAFWGAAWKLSEKWAAELAAAKKGGEQTPQLDVHEDLGAASLDMIGVAGLGHEFGALEAELARARAKLRGDGAQDAEPPAASGLARAYGKLMSSFGPSLIGILFFFFPFLARVYKSPNRQAQEEALKEINAHVSELIDGKRAAVREGKAGGGKDLLSLLMEEASREGTELTDKELRDQVMTFLVAGHETTALAVSWTLWLLAHNPAAQAALHAELSSAPALANLRAACARAAADPLLDLDPPAVAADDLDGLKYLNMAFKEALRVIPPAPLASTRVVQRDTDLTVPRPDGTSDTYLIPKGTAIMVSPYAMHMSPRLWEKGGGKVEEFRPERWEGEGGEGAVGWMPFSMGPRGCIGQKLAMIEAKTVLAVLVTRFEFEPVPGYEVKKSLRITWRPDRPLLLRVKERSLA
ncbi:cytochrome P450 [Hyaloraphidium curvatum]|nr:cytochrome P450 [Hyaloraphidium curvatum]